MRSEWRKILNQNEVVVGTAYHYILQPGDGYAYRFALLPYFEDWKQSYIMNEGVGPDAQTNFIKLVIDTYDKMYSVNISIQHLRDFPSNRSYWLYELRDNGMGDISVSWLVKILLAVKELVRDYLGVTAASKAMLKAPEIISQIYDEQEVEEDDDSEEG